MPTSEDSERESPAAQIAESPGHRERVQGLGFRAYLNPEKPTFLGFLIMIS